MITAIVDDHRYFEVQPLYGSAISVGWAHLGGRAVGFVANNPARGAGALDAAAAIKATELIETADTFGQPVIFLLDNPGVLAGSQAERNGVLKWGGRMYLAGRRLRSPKISVLMRKGFGFGLVTMAHMPHDRQTLTLALPSANIASMPAQSGGKTANLDDETRSKIERAQRGGPYGLADRLGIDEVVDPSELRNALINGLLVPSHAPADTARSATTRLAATRRAWALAATELGVEGEQAHRPLGHAVLGGDADAADHLVGVVVGLAGGEAGERRRRGGAVLVGVEPRTAPGEPPGRVGHRVRARQAVLHGLERADRSAELDAVAHVARCELDGGESPSTPVSTAMPTCQARRSASPLPAPSDSARSTRTRPIG